MKSNKQPKPGHRMNFKRPDGYPALRIWRRKGMAKQSPRLLIKCGDCENALKIYHDEEALEIGGVHGSLENWREILLPLLTLTGGK